MTTLTEAAAACCACLRVHWTETRHPGGETSGRWLCTQCGAEFSPPAGLRADMEKNTDELREFRALGGGDPRFALANVRASVENWENAPNMDVYRQAIFGAERLKDVLRRNGFRECDIAACNCGSWHAGPNLRAEKAEEVQATQEERARELIAEAEAESVSLRADLDTAAAVTSQLQAELEAERHLGEVSQAEYSQAVTHAAARIKELQEQLDAAMRTLEAGGRVTYACGPEQMVVLKADYERLIASLPAGPRLVR